MIAMADIETWKESSFEEKYGAMTEGMSEEQQRKRAEDVLHLCRCDRCPTNTDKEQLNAVYCTLGKSKETREEKGCLCADCPITKTMSLRWQYYCIRGSAVQLSDLAKDDS